MGTNDGMHGYPWYQIVGKEEITDSLPFKDGAIKYIDNSVIPTYKNLPENIDRYANSDFYTKLLWQVAASVTPNANSLLLADFPMNKNLEWIPEVRQKWREFCVMDPVGINRFLDEFKKIQFSLIVVEKNYDATNSFENEEIIKRWQSFGITINRMDMPSLHTAFMEERFIALAESMLISLNVVPVESKGKLATTWGEMKR